MSETDTKLDMTEAINENSENVNAITQTGGLKLMGAVSGLRMAMTVDRTTAIIHEHNIGGGTDLSFVTATAGDILSGKIGSDADGNPVNGTIQTVTASLKDNVVTVPQGFVASKQTLTVAEAGALSVSGNTVTIPVGYIKSQRTQTVGTAKGAETITPGTTDKTIAADTYLSGVQTIKGDADLLPENIAEGKEIFGIAGTFKGGSSIEFYKCEAVHGPYQVQTVIVSGCPDTIYNGEYLLSEFTTAGWGGQEFPVYKHVTQNYYYYYEPNNYMNWGIGLNYTDSMVYMGTVGYEWYIMPEWSMIDGMSAVYGKAWVDTDVPKTWDGYKAELNGSVYTFSDELTTGLTYADVKPEKYQIYTANGEVKAEWITEDFPTAGLILKAPLTDDLDIAETGGKISHNSTAVLGSVNGKNCVVLANSYDGVTIDFLRSIGLGDYTIFLQFAISEFNSARIYWVSNSGGSRIGVECRDQSIKFLYGSDSMHPVNQNQWYTLLVRREEGVITMSLDGVLKDTFKDDYDLTGAMYLGDNNFNGGMCNVLVYNRALNDTEAAALHNKFAAK